MTVQPPLPVLPEVYSSLTKAQRHILRNPKIPGVQLAAHETSGDKGPTSQKRTLVAPVRGLKDHPFAQEDGTASVLENFVPTLTGVEVRPGIKRLTPVSQETTNAALIETSRQDTPPGVSPLFSFIDPKENNEDVVYVLGGNSVVLSTKEPEPPQTYYEITGGFRLAYSGGLRFIGGEIQFRQRPLKISGATNIADGSTINLPFARPTGAPDLRFVFGVETFEGEDRTVYRTIPLSWPISDADIPFEDIETGIADTAGFLGFCELQARINGEWVTDRYARMETERIATAINPQLSVYDYDLDAPTSKMPDMGLKFSYSGQLRFRSGDIEIWDSDLLHIDQIQDIETSAVLLSLGTPDPFPRPSNAPDLRFAFGVNNTDGSGREIVKIVPVDWPITRQEISVSEVPSISSPAGKIAFLELQARINGQWTATTNSRITASHGGSSSGQNPSYEIFGVVRGGAEPVLFLDESPLSNPECVSIVVFDGADTTYAIMVDGTNFPRRYDSISRFKHIPDVISGDDESDESLTPAIGTQDNLGVDDGLNIEARIGLNLADDTIVVISNRSNIKEVTDINGANPKEFPVAQPNNAPDVRFLFGYRESDSGPKIVTTTVDIEWPLPNAPITFDNEVVSGAEAGGYKAFVELQQFVNGDWASDANGRAEFDFGASHDATLFLRMTFPDNSSRLFFYQEGGRGQNEDNLGQLITDDDDKVASNLDIRPQDFSYVFAFKSRLFFIEKDSTNAWYLDVLNVSGPVSKLPLGGILPFNSPIIFGLGWSTQWGDDLADRAIFVTREGHVAAYHGTPGLDSFELQGTYRISPPMGKHAHFQYGGDVYVLTGDGIVSLNALVQGQALGSGSPYITDPIRSQWRAIAQERKASCHWRCAVWPSRGLAFVFNNDPEFNETLMLAVNLFQFTWSKVVFNKLLEANNVITGEDITDETEVNGGNRDYLAAGITTVGDECFLVDSWGNLYTFGAGRDEYFYYNPPVDEENPTAEEGDQTANAPIEAIACMTPVNHGSNVRATDMRTLWRGDPIEDVKSLLPPVLPGELEKENIRPWPVPKSAEDSRTNPRRWSRVPRRITKAQEEFASPTVQVAVERELEPTSELTHIEYRVTDAGT